MKDFLENQCDGSITFDAGDVKILTGAFEAAWTALEFAFRNETAKARSDARLQLARLTVLAAAGGERRPNMLKRQVLAAWPASQARWTQDEGGTPNVVQLFA